MIGQVVAGEDARLALQRHVEIGRPHHLAADHRLLGEVVSAAGLLDPGAVAEGAARIGIGVAGLDHALLRAGRQLAIAQRQLGQIDLMRRRRLRN